MIYFYSREVFDEMNQYALKHYDFGICLAIVISSKVFDNMALNDCKVRNCMFTILQGNYESKFFFNLLN